VGVGAWVWVRGRAQDGTPRRDDIEGEDATRDNKKPSPSARGRAGKRATWTAQAGGQERAQRIRGTVTPTGRACTPVTAARVCCSGARTSGRMRQHDIRACDHRAGVRPGGVQPAGGRSAIEPACRR
jgi:hypothetical protein